MPIAESEKAVRTADLKARTKRMEFHNIDCITDGGLSVELDPDGKIDDLNPFNNKVEYRY